MFRGGGWIDKAFADGMRKCLAEEFDKIYILHLRGDVRKDRLSGNRDEGENIFGSGSQTGIAITILVRGSETAQEKKVYFKDIGIKLSREQKLRTLQKLRSLGTIAESNGWHEIVPNESYEWINQGDKAFSKYMWIKKKGKQKELELFSDYTLGITTKRDTWLVNFSPEVAKHNATRLVKFFNDQLSKQVTLDEVLPKQENIKWSTELVNRYTTNKYLNDSHQSTITTLYRPFTKSNLVKNKELISRYSRNEYVFPAHAKPNRVIAVSGPGFRGGFSVLMSDQLVDAGTLEATQCFPLALYSDSRSENDGLWKTDGKSEIREQDGITDDSLKYFSKKYGSHRFDKEDLFYYIYGLLHSQEYRTRFANNLAKELPRIPAVRRLEDFLAFSEAGRKLGNLHVNYESVEPYPVHIKEGNLKLLSPSVDRVKYFRVSKMKFGGSRSQKDKSTVMYNDRITMQNIPLEAYDYVVSGKPALKWVMDQQCVKTDKKSGITNDANDYANEVIQDPAYPLELFQRVITVSLETMKIVGSLPQLDID